MRTGWRRISFNRFYRAGAAADRGIYVAAVEYTGKDGHPTSTPWGNRNTMLKATAVSPRHGR